MKDTTKMTREMLYKERMLNYVQAKYNFIQISLKCSSYKMAFPEEKVNIFSNELKEQFKIYCAYEREINQYFTKHQLNIAEVFKDTDGYEVALPLASFYKMQAYKQWLANGFIQFDYLINNSFQLEHNMRKVKRERKFLELMEKMEKEKLKETEDKELEDLEEELEDLGKIEKIEKDLEELKDGFNHLKDLKDDFNYLKDLEDKEDLE